MQVQVYGIPNCGSVKKARSFLESHGVEYVFVDFKKTPPSRDKIVYWIQKTSLQVLLNTKGTTYKKLGLKEQNLNDEQKIQAMLQNPTLIKRPVIESGDVVIVGYDENVLQVLL
ncbi:arsenate reductase family protein [Helicobacter sp. TUL]|uniref:arsenate reductase family protein n=1 Tax=Helicobacter sp. TUL TaxID=1848928 RepID=UPI000BAB7BFF|nr:Spx/MgsR family RNA polymerase-binding regulatory protein [Helicobacter sp. TUL]PAV00823.1 arsenate reductase family protein [Helicobacter sp. TUL]